jgi:hypothetical protein
MRGLGLLIRYVLLFRFLIDGGALLMVICRVWLFRRLWDALIGRIRAVRTFRLYRLFCRG